MNINRRAGGLHLHCTFHQFLSYFNQFTPIMNWVSMAAVFVKIQKQPHNRTTTVKKTFTVCSPELLWVLEWYFFPSTDFSEVFLS